MTLKRKLSPQEKDQIFHLHNQGLTGPEIADLLKIDDTRQVVGIIRAAVNFKKIPSMTPPPRVPGAPITMLQQTPPPPDPGPIQIVTIPAATPPEESSRVSAPPATPVVHMAGAAPALAAPSAVPLQKPQHRPQLRALPSAEPRPQPASAPAEALEGWSSGWSQSAGFSGGFNYLLPTRKYMVYRLDPNDGLLGEHADPFGERELAERYGSGQYKVLRFDPGNPRPYELPIRISENYGPPRFSNRGNAAPSARPGYSRWQRWGRPQEPREEEGVNEPVYDRPRSMYDFARHSTTATADATAAAAIKALGDLNTRALDQVEQARRQGPDTYMARLFQDQQTALRDQLEQQRREADQRRRDDEERADRRHKEEEQEHRRREEEEQKRHERELDKIKLEMQAREKQSESERKLLLDLEEKRHQVMRDEHKMRQETLENELRRTREETAKQSEKLEKKLEEMQQETSDQIQANQVRMEKELERDRQALDREYKLREKGQEKELELQGKILDIRKETIEAQGSNEILQVVNNVINKFSASFKELVEFKRIEAAATMSPEAQAAAVQKGLLDKKPEAAEAAVPPPAPAGTPEEMAQQPQSPQTAAGAAAAASSNGNGHAVQPKAEERPMEEIIQSMMDQKFMQQVIKEWELHVRTKQNATTFVNMYIEWMRDPNDHEARKATTAFAHFITPRSWADLYKIMKPKLQPHVIQTFETPEAEEYYETFKALVTEQISAFWEEWAQEREALKAQRRAASRPQIQAQPQAQVQAVPVPVNGK